MKTYLTVLQKCGLFAGIAENQLLTLLSCLGATACTYEKNQVILSEGEATERIGVVLAGAVQIIRVDYYGNRSILTELQPTGMFGESFACADVCRWMWWQQRKVKCCSSMRNAFCICAAVPVGFIIGSFII